MTENTTLNVGGTLSTTDNTTLNSCLVSGLPGNDRFSNCSISRNNWEIMRVTKGEYHFKPLHIVVVHLYANGAKLKKGII